MRAQGALPAVRIVPAGLYRQEIFSDRRAGTIRRLTPVTVEGGVDTTRPVLFSGQTQLLTPAGVLPLVFENDARTLEEALKKIRSEEGRVGEECRSRWSPYYLKKKRDLTYTYIAVYND